MSLQPEQDIDLKKKKSQCKSLSVDEQMALARLEVELEKSGRSKRANLSTHVQEKHLTHGREGEGSRGGHIIGHTKSGKPVYGPPASVFHAALEETKERRYNFDTNRGTSKRERELEKHARETATEHAKQAHKDFTHTDHLEAALLYRIANNQSKNHREAHNEATTEYHHHIWPDQHRGKISFQSSAEHSDHVGHVERATSLMADMHEELARKKEKSEAAAESRRAKKEAQADDKTAEDPNPYGAQQEQVQLAPAKKRSRGKKASTAQKINVATTKGPVEIDAKHVVGDFAAHKPHAGGKGWDITHVPSGLHVRNVNSESEAKRAVSHMHAVAGSVRVQAGLTKDKVGDAEHKESMRKLAEAYNSFDPKAPQKALPKPQSPLSDSQLFTPSAGMKNAAAQADRHGMSAHIRSKDNPVHAYHRMMEEGYGHAHDGHAQLRHGKTRANIDAANASFNLAAMRFEDAHRHQVLHNLDNELMRTGDLNAAHRLGEYHRKLIQHHNLQKSDNTFDIDLDTGHFGVADYNGQMAMRVVENAKCRGCLHYSNEGSACKVGLVPKVCGDGTYPELGYAPAAPNRIASKNWVQRHREAVVENGPPPDASPVINEIPYRIEVLGDSALSLSESWTLVKSVVDDPQRLAAWIWHHQASPATKKKYDPKGKGGKTRPSTAWMEHMEGKLSARKGWHDPEVVEAVTQMTGVAVAPKQDMVIKSRFDLDDFAEHLGTTTDVVRSIAHRLGDKHAFQHFIKSKLPDIMMRHGLDEAAVNSLYRAAVNTLKSMTSTEWASWQGVRFGEDVEDAELAAAIAQRGLLDPNAIVRSSIVTPAEPPQVLPSEPIQAPPQQPMPTAFVGGNLHLAGIITRG